MFNDPTHIYKSGTGNYYSKILKREVYYYFENEDIIPNLSPDECLLEEDIIEEIKKAGEESQCL